MTPCLCPPGRPLGSPHEHPCPQAAAAEVVQMFRNGETGRPIAVPDEIVTEAEREYRAYKLSLQGVSWYEIAKKELYHNSRGEPDGQIASNAVKRYLDEGRAVVGDYRRQEVLATEVAVVRAVREAMWDGMAISKKPSYAMAVLATHDRMVRIFGLDQADDSDATVQTVVVPSDDYIRTLEEATRPQVVEDEGTTEADAG